MPRRILIAKPGLDGHDRGIKVVANAGGLNPHGLGAALGTLYIFFTGAVGGGLIALAGWNWWQGYQLERAEQQELTEEKQQLEKLLGSERRMKTLIKKELMADAKQFGDERRSILAERDAAQALRQEDLVPSEPVTVVLSKSGWVRSAKGHEIDPSSLNYKAGDEFQHSARGRSNLQAVFLDSRGRAYSLAAHTLPSARSLGEPPVLKIATLPRSLQQ